MFNLRGAGTVNGHSWEEATADYTDDCHDYRPHRYDRLSHTTGNIYSRVTSSPVTMTSYNMLLLSPVPTKLRGDGPTMITVCFYVCLSFC